MNNTNNANNINNTSRVIYCGNCGKKGHIYKNCYKPVISLGIICMKFDNLDINDAIKKNRENNFIYSRLVFDELYLNKDLNIDKIIKDNLKFLLICRKNSLSFIEFVRGNYNLDTLNDIEHIKNIILKMTQPEIEKIKECKFDDLWNAVWFMDDFSSLHKKEYEKSREKFQKLVDGFHINNTYININTIITVIPIYHEPEWEFPKGRRNIKESDIECANREFKEESNFLDEEYKLLDTKPISEIFMGTNSINYKYTYFLAQSTKIGNPSISHLNNFQHIEISNIGWFTVDEALEKIRDYSVERKEILKKVFNLIYYNIYQYLQYSSPLSSHNLSSHN